MLRIGIDIGGTFTDFVIYNSEDEGITTLKILTDNSNPAETVLKGLKQLTLGHPVEIIHGSTVATNALLERKGVPTALITTQGFKDILQIGRQNRPNIYDWNLPPPNALVPSEFRFEVNERIDFHGKVCIPFVIEEIEDISKHITVNKIESIAICLLFSFLHPEHEQQIASYFRRKGYFVSVSSEILPEYREYERTSTTVINAYVTPILDKYLNLLQHSIPNSNIQIMQSNGGMINLADARQNGVRCILSGPAGGIVGAQFIAQSIQEPEKNHRPSKKIKIITFDMGGTSTDVSLVDGQPTLSTDAVVGGYSIHIPILDIHTIGAGGGSIAYIDPGGLLQVGPQSAGANPGPACYGVGELPTVTDANLVLGRILPDYFLGGKMKIYPERAYKAMKNIGRIINLSPVQVSHGIIRIVNAQMERALRVISVERGYDPRDFYLFSYGGAGGLHVVDLARNLRIPRVIISKFASTMSAFGMLASNVIKDYSQTVMLPGTIGKEVIEKLFSPLTKQGIHDIKNQGFQDNEIEIFRNLDIRYSGQSYELLVPFTNDFINSFHMAHTMMYGYSHPERQVEIVNIRISVVGKVSPIKLSLFDAGKTDTSPIIEKYIKVEMNEGAVSIPVYKYDHLLPGIKFVGPALIVSSDTTVLINPQDNINVDNYLNLIIDIDFNEENTYVLNSGNIEPLIG
jgi:N-methylhydantoinase A